MAMEWDRLLNPGRLCRPDFEEKPGRPPICRITTVSCFPNRFAVLRKRRRCIRCIPMTTCITG